AEGKDLAFAVDNSGAEHEVAGAAGVRAARPGKAAGDRAAERRLRAEMRRLEGQHLVMRRERGFEIAQRGAGAGGYHELRRLMVDDAAVAGDGKRFPPRRAAVKTLG